MPQLPEPVARLDQLELIVSQSAEEELRRPVCELQPLLFQQRLLDLEQRVREQVPPGRKGQKEQIAQELPLVAH